MGWAHTEETRLQHHEAGPYLNPQGKRKRGRTRNTWRRDLEADTKRLGHTWKQLESLAGDRDAWRTLVGRLYPTRGSQA